MSRMIRIKTLRQTAPGPKLKNLRTLNMRYINIKSTVAKPKSLRGERSSLNYPNLRSYKGANLKFSANSCHIPCFKVNCIKSYKNVSTLVFTTTKVFVLQYIYFFFWLLFYLHMTGFFFTPTNKMF